MRKDIQGLRALAVLAVFGYHMRPDWVTGGFAGVDVFFVVSGFLISAHLLKEIRDTGSIRLALFWSRRARRLLPASFTVLAASLAAVWFIVPQPLQERFYRDISAATLYVANWVFAADATDYLASSNSPSIAQHFWSLGVEEQIYLIWPLLLVALWKALRFRFSPAAIFVAGISLVTVNSFAYSVFLVVSNDPSGYFSTLSRVWEFGLGALVAVVSVWRPGWKLQSESFRAGIAWSSWLVLLSFVFVFNSEFGFPGAWALVPTAATCFILLAQSSENDLGLSRLIGMRPVQFLGDNSYSIYLWHWPLLVIAGLYYPRVPWFWLIAIFLLTIFLAYLTTHLIEKPFRFGRLKQWRPRFTFSATASAMVMIIAISQAGSVAVAREVAKIEIATLQLEAEVAERFSDRSGKKSPEAVIEPVWDEVTCMGPAYLVESECSEFSWDSYLPPVGAFDRTAHEVEPLAMSGSVVGCLAWKDRYDLITCTFGVLGGEKWVLIGDSHAYQWLPAMNQVAQRNNIELHLMARAGCPPNSETRDAAWEHQRGCQSWYEEVKGWFSENRDVEKVMFGSFSGTTFAGGYDQSSSNPLAVAGYQEVWQDLTEFGAELLVIRDTPYIGEDVYSCVERNPEKLEVCDQSRVVLAGKPDDAARAAGELGVQLVDMWDYFCRPDVCEIVLGGIRVYKDSNHFSGTFGLLLATYLEKELGEALPSSTP